MKNTTMTAIRKTGEGYYLVSLTGQKEELKRNDCYLLKKEIMTIIKPHREISINIKGIKTIDKGCINILQELKNAADSSRCKLRFINTEQELAPMISGLEKSIQRQKEYES